MFYIRELSAYSVIKSTGSYTSCFRIRIASARFATQFSVSEVTWTHLTKELKAKLPQNANYNFQTFWWKIQIQNLKWHNCQIPLQSDPRSHNNFLFYIGLIISWHFWNNEILNPILRGVKSQTCPPSNLLALEGGLPSSLLATISQGIKFQTFLFTQSYRQL